MFLERSHRLVPLFLSIVPRIVPRSLKSSSAKAIVEYREPLDELAMSDVTQTLEAIMAGDSGATEKLFPLVYSELRRLAAIRLARELPGQTLEPTALVHEAYIRLVGDANFQWQSRSHFF